MPLSIFFGVVQCSSSFQKVFLQIHVNVEILNTMKVNSMTYFVDVSFNYFSSEISIYYSDEAKTNLIVNVTTMLSINALQYQFRITYQKRTKTSKYIFSTHIIFIDQIFLMTIKHKKITN